MLRVVSGDAAQELRQQIGDAVQTGAHRKDDEDHAGVAFVGQQLEPDDRILRHILPGEQAGDADDGQHAQPHDHLRIEPVLPLTFLQHDRQGTQADGEPCDAEPVCVHELVPVGLALGKTRVQQRNQSDADRDVHEEAPAPVYVLGEPAAEDGAKEGAEQHDQSKQGHADRKLMAWQPRPHDRLGRGNHRAARESLADSSNDHLRQAV